MTNTANFNNCANWGELTEGFGNVTTVGTNGSPSAYCTYDQDGNVWEFVYDNDVTYSIPIFGGSFDNSTVGRSTTSNFAISTQANNTGFRICSPVTNIPDVGINFVMVGNINNIPDNYDFGSVSYFYRISKYPITNNNYVEFLNAIASTDTYELYYSNMFGDPAYTGIERQGENPPYTYAAKPNMGNKPVVFISWFNAARYCNWLHNAKPIGYQTVGNDGFTPNFDTTESGVYTLNGANIYGATIPKNNNAKYYIPTTHEWWKAAYYKGGNSNAGYWQFATQYDNSTSCVTADNQGNGPHNILCTTTTTSTTTINPANFVCPCGSLYIPVGSKYNSKGLGLRLYFDNSQYVDFALTHTQDALVSNGLTFVTTTEKIILNQSIQLKQCVLFCDQIYNLQIKNSIRIIAKDYVTKQILFVKNIGQFKDAINFDDNIIENKTSVIIDGNVTPNTINLFNSRIQVEIQSLCDGLEYSSCCVDIPTDLNLYGATETLTATCCSTTLAPILGACCERGSDLATFIQYSRCLGEMTVEECDPRQGFESQRVWIAGGKCDVDCESSKPTVCEIYNMETPFTTTIAGLGLFDGQEAEVIVNKTGNTYFTTGTFPCGIDFFVSMTCNELSNSFCYDGYISCCDESTKIVSDCTEVPLLIPNTVIKNLLIEYIKCDCAEACSTSTTTTQPPKLPCNPLLNPNPQPVTIQGYAFYKSTKGTINIPSVGSISSKCSGGHKCDKTNFLPQLHLKSGIIIDATNTINLNNGSDGGDREASFSFNIPLITMLSGGASVQLKCMDNICHKGVTQVVLTITIDNQPYIVFNSCILPNSLSPLSYTCEDEEPTTTTTTTPVPSNVCCDLSSLTFNGATYSTGIDTRYWTYDYVEDPQCPYDPAFDDGSFYIFSVSEFNENYTLILNLYCNNIPDTQLEIILDNPENLVLNNNVILGTSTGILSPNFVGLTNTKVRVTFTQSNLAANGSVVKIDFYRQT